MGKLMEIFSGKKDVDQIQRNLNWVDNQIKNLEQTKFILDQQINKMKSEREKLIEKLKK
jgi:archaellum component FlaC